MSSKKARVIAFYLPQFHPIPENDLWWGKGFTEWTNVAKAKPLFKNHYQPRIPADLGFYDLRIPEVRQAQAELAREAGIEGFCYYHYWFGNGKRLLERPFQEVLRSNKPDFPFCLCWANHSWSNRTWEKSNLFEHNSLLMEQQYLGENDYTEHFYSILDAFKDERYIKIDEKPIFLIYDVYAFEEISFFIKKWRELAKLNGLKDIYFIGMTNSTLSFRFNSKGQKVNVLPNLVSSSEVYNYVLNLGFDAVNSFGKRRGEMLYSGKYADLVKKILTRIGLNFVTNKFDYEKTVRGYFVSEDKWENVFPTILPQWDRSARVGKADGVYVNSQPEKFKIHVENALKYVLDKEPEHRVIFLKSWNVWAEGNYIEPDLRYGKKYIEVLNECLNKENK